MFFQFCFSVFGPALPSYTSQSVFVSRSVLQELSAKRSGKLTPDTSAVYDIPTESLEKVNIELYRRHQESLRRQAELKQHQAWKANHPTLMEVNIPGVFKANYHPTLIKVNITACFKSKPSQFLVDHSFFFFFIHKGTVKWCKFVS